MIKGLSRLFIRTFIFCSISAIVVIAGAFMWFNHLWQTPLMQSEDRLLLIASGTNHNQLASQLYDEGYLPELWYYPAFRFGFSLVEEASFSPKAGEFEVPAGATYAKLFSIIDEGVPYQHRIAIIEGTTARDIVVALNKEKRMAGAILRVPDEGTLAPDTYFFVRGTQRADMIDRMQRRQEIILAEEWANRSRAVSYQSAQQALIMASIVEKETALIREQPLVASVFLNRIKADMRLQSDATVLYGIIEEEGRHREVLSKDLKEDSPWNSYTRKGYPKTPIGNPSRGAIRAALNPLPSTYFYFVADGQGGHKFAKTYPEHQNNVAAYRRLRAAQKNK